MSDSTLLAKNEEKVEPIPLYEHKIIGLTTKRENLYDKINKSHKNIHVIDTSEISTQQVFTKIMEIQKHKIQFLTIKL